MIVNNHILTERQTEIIQSAGKIMSVDGISGLKIKRIASEMGFSEAAIYRHFKSKEAIILSMLKLLETDLGKRISGIDQELNPQDRLNKLFESQIDYFNEHPYFVVAIFSDGLIQESEAINIQVLKVMKIKMDFLLSTILEGQQKGFFRKDVQTLDIVHIILGAFRLQMFKWRLSGFKSDINKMGNKLIESINIILKS